MSNTPPTALDQLLVKQLAQNGTPLPARQYLNVTAGAVLSDDPNFTVNGEKVGATEAAFTGGSSSAWTRYNFTGSGGAQASGAVLPNSAQAIDVLVDTAGGATIVGAPTSPFDDQPMTLKDPNGSWGTTAAKLMAATGWAIELPAAPGTYSATGATVTLWKQAGASISWSADAVQKIWLLR